MSHQQNQHNNRTYKDHQYYLYGTHETLQELTAHIESIHNILIRSSSALLYAHMYASGTPQMIKLAIAQRALNSSIYQLANANFDLAEFRKYLVPFNKPLPSSPSSSTASEASSHAEESLGSLLEDP